MSDEPKTSFKAVALLFIIACLFICLIGSAIWLGNFLQSKERAKEREILKQEMLTKPCCEQGYKTQDCNQHCNWCSHPFTIGDRTQMKPHPCHQGRCTLINPITNTQCFCVRPEVVVRVEK
jgi:hypothetical protein